MRRAELRGSAALACGSFPAWPRATACRFPHGPTGRDAAGATGKLPGNAAPETAPTEADRTGPGTRPDPGRWPIRRLQQPAQRARLGAVLASHDDTTAEQVADSRGKGVAFAEFPTTLEAAAACRAQGITIMMGAPNIVRGGSHSGNVSALALAEAGLLDIVSSDYVPASLLLAAFRLAEVWNDLPRAVRTVTE